MEVWAATAMATLSPAAGVAAGLLGARTAQRWGGEAWPVARGGWGAVLLLAALGTAAAFVALAAFRGAWAVAAAGLGLAFIYAGTVDLRVRLLPDAPTIAAGVVGVAWSFDRGGVPGLALAATGAAAAAAAMALVRLVFTRRLGREAMGLGDVKLAGAAGALLGPFAVWGALAAAAAATIAAAFVFAWRTGRDLRAPIPFGPALLAATWLGWAMAAWPG